MHARGLAKIIAVLGLCSLALGADAQKSKNWYLYWVSPDLHEVVHITDDEYSSEGIVVMAWSRIYNESTRRLTYSADIYDCGQQRAANNYFREFDTAVRSNVPIREQENKNALASLTKVKQGSRQQVAIMNVCSGIGPRARPWKEAGENFKFISEELLRNRPQLRNVRPQ